MPLLRIGALASASDVGGGHHSREVSNNHLRPTDIYVAAPLATRKDAYAVGLALKLARPSIRLVSSWMDLCVAGRLEDPDAQHERELVLWDNIRDIERSDVVVALTTDDTPKATVGDIVWALAIGTPVVWVTRGPQGRSIWDAHWGVKRVEAIDPLRSIVEIATAIDEVIAARPERPIDPGNQAAGSTQETRPSVIVDAEALHLYRQEGDALALALTEAFEAYPDTQQALHDWACVLALPAPPIRMVMAAKSALRVAESRHTATSVLGRACRTAHKRLCMAQEHLEVLSRRPAGSSS